MRRLMAALLVLALLAPAPALALRPRAGRELQATTTGLATGLEERAHSPAAGLEETRKARMLRRLVNELPSLQALQRPAYTVESEGSLPIARNLIRGPGGRRFLHLHLIRQRSTLGDSTRHLLHGLRYEIWMERTTIRVGRPKIEPKNPPGGFADVADLRPLLGRQKTNRLRKRLIILATATVHRNTAALREALAQLPEDIENVLGMTAEGLEVMASLRGDQNRNNLSPDDTRWFYDPENRVTARRLDALSRFPNPKTLKVPAREEVLAILRYWGRRPAREDTRFRDVQVLTEDALHQHPWLMTFLTALPVEFKSRIAVLTDAGTLPDEAKRAVTVASTPQELMARLSQGRAKNRWAHIASDLRVYTDNQGVVEALGAATPTIRGSWTVIPRPLSDLSATHRLTFLHRILTGLLTMPEERQQPTGRMTYRRMASDCAVGLLARRLTEWLAAPDAGLEEPRRRTTSPRPKYWRRVPSHAERVREAQQNILAVIARIVRHPTWYAAQSERGIPFLRNLVGERGGQRFLHLHLAPSDRIPKTAPEWHLWGDLHGMLFKLRRTARGTTTIAISEGPWMESSGKGGPFFDLAAIAPQPVRRQLFKAAMRSLAPHRTALSQARWQRPPMVLGTTITPGAEGYLVMGTPGEDLGRHAAVWFDQRSSLMAAPLDTRARPSRGARATVTPRDETLAVLTSWGLVWNKRHRHPWGLHQVQVIPAAALTPTHWLMPLLQAWPKAFAGHLILLGDDAALAPFRAVPGLILARNPAELFAIVAQDTHCKAEERLLAIYGGTPELTRAARTHLPAWQVLSLPARRLDGDDRIRFLATLKISAEHINAFGQFVNNDDVHYLADRLEQWL